MMFYCSVDLMSMIVKILTRDVLGYRNITFMYAAMSAVRSLSSRFLCAGMVHGSMIGSRPDQWAAQAT